MKKWYLLSCFDPDKYGVALRLIEEKVNSPSEFVNIK